MCESAVTRRAWGDGLHHLLDVRTGLPVQDVVAAWVVADEAATADGLATALFFTEADQLAKVFPFAYVRMLADGRAETSHNFDGELFSRVDRSADRACEHNRQGCRPSTPPNSHGIEEATTASKGMRATMAGVAAALVLAGCSTTGRARRPPRMAVAPGRDQHRARAPLTQTAPTPRPADTGAFPRRSRSPSPWPTALSPP
ncbi:MAG: FAD:protein FMN transferase [Candidatus Limnocylindria bacterium]